MVMPIAAGFEIGPIGRELCCWSLVFFPPEREILLLFIDRNPKKGKFVDLSLHGEGSYFSFFISSPSQYIRKLSEMRN